MKRRKGVGKREVARQESSSPSSRSAAQWWLGWGGVKKWGGGWKEKFPRLGELKNWVWGIKKLYPPN